MDPNSLINIPLTPEQMAGVLTPEKVAALVLLVGVIVHFLKSLPYVLKLTGWLPMVDIGLGIGLCYLVNINDPIYCGIIVGLVAAGGYKALGAVNSK